MSCNFNASTCKSCPKYNGCLLQIIYSNTISLASMISQLADRQDELALKINEINISPSTVAATNEESNESSKQMLILTKEMNNLKNSLSMLDVKVDDIINANNEYEYVEEETKK